MSAVWYFTAPWDAVPIRRGDALGLRAGADYFADLIAPGLSNGTSDARWIILLSWCLKWSHVAWRNAGCGDLLRRDEQLARYAWLRPLELLWIDRTLEAGQTTGQLRGRRSVERWRKADRKFQNFAMSPDQFRRYRQVGTYGAYRVVFRTMAGLTTGDGWTPGAIALQLADLVNTRLPPNAQLKQEKFENGTRWGSWRGQETRFWTERGWREWKSEPSEGLLPASDNALRTPLSKEECSILAPVLFGEGSVRRATAQVLANATDIRSHAELCDKLAASKMFGQEIQSSLAPLPAFTRLADAAMDAMRALWNTITQDGEAHASTIEKLAQSVRLQKKLELLNESSNAWLREQARNAFPHESVATQLANTMQGASTTIGRIRALTKHHTESGGGRRWFREQAGSLVPLVADTGIAASDYRFRLRSICLLAAQCGVAKMDGTLNILLDKQEDDENGDDE